jgi:hypothetical protein
MSLLCELTVAVRGSRCQLNTESPELTRVAGPDKQHSENRLRVAVTLSPIFSRRRKSFERLIPEGLPVDKPQAPRIL